MKSINFEEFIEQYEPIKNQFDENAAYDGYGFETFGIELNEVIAQNRFHVWTLINCDDELDFVIPGYNIVNRQMYFICKNPWSIEEIEVDVNEKCHVNKAKYVCIEFLEENGLLTTEIEDKLHDYWSGKF